MTGFWDYVGNLSSKYFRFSNSLYSRVGVYVHLAVYVHPYEAKLCDQWLNLAENWFVNSYLEFIGTLWSRSFRFSNSFHLKVGIYAHLAVRYKAKLRSQWADLAENWRVSSYSNPIDTLWSKSFRFSSSFHSKVGIFAHLAVRYEAKLRSQWADLAENRAVSSYSILIATLWSKSFRFSNSFHSKDGLYVHLAVPYEAKVRNQWTDLAENRAVSSYSNHIATLWSKSFRFSTSFHSKDVLYVHLGIAQKATVRSLSDGVPALPSIPSSHLKPVPCLGEDMQILIPNWLHSANWWRHFWTAPK